MVLDHQSLLHYNHVDEDGTRESKHVSNLIDDYEFAKTDSEYITRIQDKYKLIIYAYIYIYIYIHIYIYIYIYIYI